MTTDVLARDDAQERAKLISNVQYAVHLDLSDDFSRKIYGSTAVATFDAADGGSTFINFEGKVDEVWLNGRKLPASCFDGKRVKLDNLKASGNQLKVVGQAQYHSDGVGLHRIKDPADGEVYLYTHFEPFDAHVVFACFDQPDIKAKATFSVTAPSKWAVVSNDGELRNEATKDGRTTHHFQTTKSLSSYLNAAISGPYRHVTDTYVSPLTGKTIELGLYCRGSMLKYLEKNEIFETTKQGLKYYETFFGIPYPFEKYDQFFVAEFNMGAMENPGCVTFNESYLFRSRVTERSRGQRADTILHEMAHMWFGDLAAPLTRQNISGALWNMVRDAQMPSRQYFDITLAHLATEPDADALASALRDAGSAAVYAHPSAREEMRARVAQAAKTGMEAPHAVRSRRSYAMTVATSSTTGHATRSSIVDHAMPLTRTVTPPTQWNGETALAKPVRSGTRDPKMFRTYIATATAAAIPPPSDEDPVADATRNASMLKPAASSATAASAMARTPRSTVRP